MLPAGVHIGTQAFAVAGTNEWFLTWIKDAECDPVVEIMSRVFTRGMRLVVSSISNLGHSELGWPFSFPVAGRVSESSGLRRHDLALRCAEARMMSLRSNARLALRKGRSNQHRVEKVPSSPRRSPPPPAQCLETAKKCADHAAQCDQLAEQAHDEQARLSLRGAAASWRELARHWFELASERSR